MGSRRLPLIYSFSDCVKNFEVVVGTGKPEFHNTVDAFQTCKMATQARAVNAFWPAQDSHPHLTYMQPWTKTWTKSVANIRATLQRHRSTGSTGANARTFIRRETQDGKNWCVSLWMKMVIGSSPFRGVMASFSQAKRFSKMKVEELGDQAYHMSIRWT